VGGAALPYEGSVGSPRTKNVVLIRPPFRIDHLPRELKNPDFKFKVALLATRLSHFQQNNEEHFTG
jgi:hypothetical protein